MDQKQDKHIAVVGAGIVGICCALYLQREGFQVTLIDRDGPGEGTSFGNAGVFSSGAVHPVGMPGLWRKIPKMLLDPLAPLTIRLSYAHRIAPWLLRLLRASTPERVEEISKGISALSLPGLDYFEPLLKAAGAEHLVRRNGCLNVFETEAGFAAARADNIYRERRGTKFDMLGPEELRQMAPGLRSGFAGAIFHPLSGSAVSPIQISQSLARHFEAQGGAIRQATVTDLQRDNGEVSAVICAEGQVHCDGVVIAAGAYSKAFAAMLGDRIPLDTERGYHMVFPNAEVDLPICLLVSERGCGVTVMAEGLRLAGTVEFAGLDAAPDYRRADVLKRHAAELFPDADLSGGEPWMGRRPSLPDSLPVISRSGGSRNTFYAFGHGHLGLTQAAVTGSMIADMVSSRTPKIDPTPYRHDRF